MAYEIQEALPIYKPQPLKGLNQIPEEEKKAFIDEQIALGKLPKAWKFSQADRLFKNKQFKDKYGEEAYAKIANKSLGSYVPPEERDKYYDYKEYLAGVESKYQNDPNLNEYKAMTPEGLKDLLDSDIMSQDELKAREDEINSYRKSNPENQVKPKSKFWAALANANAEYDVSGFPTSSVSLKDVADAVAYDRGLLDNNPEQKTKVKEKFDRFVGNLKSQGEGAVSIGIPDDEADTMIKSLYSSQAKKIQDLRRREDDRIINLPEVQQETRKREDLEYNRINNGESSYNDVEETFAQVFDNDVRKDGAGSRYYTWYKDKKELANFGVDDQLKMLTEYQVLTDFFNGNQAKAMEVLDTKMFNIAKDNQGFFKRRMNVLAGTAAKMNSMLINETFGGYADMAHAFLDSPEDYKTYKTAEKVLTSGGLGYMFNPNYWNYVDQYAVWSPYEIQRINDNGGIGGRMNLYSPTGKMTGEQFIDEGFKMLGYMLPAAAISAVTKNVKPGSFLGTVIPLWETTGSAAALGSAYSSGLYNNVLLEAKQKADQLFDQESGDYIKQYYAEHPNFVKDYMKSKGFDINDDSIMSIPVRQEAERALYEEAKASYFDKNPDRAEVYDEMGRRALYDAQRGALIDQCIETGRMIASGAFWGKWTKSQLTRDFFNAKLNPVTVVGRTAQQASRGATRAKAAALTLLSGGVDNGLDDVTVGIGKAIGLNDYNNYVGSIYGGKDAVEGAKFTASVLDGIVWGIQGADEALKDPQTWIDTALGAAGSILGTRVNGATLLHDVVRREGIFSGREGAAKNSKKFWDKQTALQKWNRYVTNGVLTSMADADVIYDRTANYIDKIQKEVFPKYERDIQKVGGFLTEQIDFNDMANNVLEGKDIKQIGMLRSAIRMLDGLKDPVISQLPEVSKFSDMLNRGKDGNFTYDEIQSFINDPSNTVIKQRVEETGDTSLAVEQMQKNVNNFLEISNKYNSFNKGLSRNPKFNSLTDDAKTQIAVQLTLRDIWRDRLNSMQESLGTKGTEKSEHSYEAEFGNKERQETIAKSLESLIKKGEEEVALRNKRLEVKEDAYSKITDEDALEAAIEDYNHEKFIRDYALDVIEENKRLLRGVRRAQVAFNEDGFVRTLSKEEVMHLPPKQRAEMLNEVNRKNYSPEQQVVLDELTDELRNNIDENGNTQDLYQVALDAGVMQERLESSEASIRKVVESPLMLQQYMNRVRDRRDALIAQAAIDETKRGQLEKLSTVSTPEEAINVVFRGRHPANTLDKGFYIPADVVKEYVSTHPESSETFEESINMVQTLDDLYLAAESLFAPEEAAGIKAVIAAETRNANSREEMISSLENTIDNQTSPDVKLQFDRVLEKMQSFGYQRDATKVRNRELERQKRIDEEAQKQLNEAKKDGKNYNWDGYKVGDTVYNKESGNPATVVGFEGKDTMMLEITYTDGKKGVYRYHSEKSKDAITKEKPTTPNNAQPAIDDTVIGENPTNSAIELVGVEEVNLEVDSEGKIDSPTAQQQAEAAKTTVQEVPTSDATDQGNNIPENINGTISGNRWVTYSVAALKDGIVREEIPENQKSVYGRLVEWLHNNKIKLQEIIDEEFGRIISDNPNTEVKFMMMKQDDTNNPLQKILFNVIELTPSLRNKYHNEDRGGVIQANGKTWLVVGTTGFDNAATKEYRDAYDAMKAPISRRRTEYFNANSAELYYVDPVASTKVQNTTSGRIVNQRLGESSPRLKKVSELLKSDGKTLRQASFGIQTNQAGIKSFAVSKNVGEDVKVFPPRNVEDNRGRVFILLDTANGNKIPGMIEPAMFNDLAENSPLKEMINNTLVQLFSTNFETREKGIKELCGYLVLGEDKNILIGTKNADVITIKRAGMPDITQQLGAKFDAAKFMKDLENANFQVNITLNTLNDPVMLKIYDDSNALMTTVDSTRTAGMSYTLYMTDAAGKPIVLTPVGNAVPGTGRSEFKKYKSVRVNNTTYEFKDGQWVNRSNGNKVNPGTSLERSVIYNNAIQEGNWVPFATKDGKELYSVVTNTGETIIVTRDGLGNVEELTQQQSNAINLELQAKIDNKARLENLEEVNLEDVAPPKPKQETTLTPEQIAQQAVGDFETSAQPEIKPQPQKEVVKEAKETKSQQPKEVIADTGKKSLTELQNTGNLSTFVEVAASEEYSDLLYDVLEAKGWDVTGDFAKDEDILKAHKVSTTGITNVQDWINQIRDCK